MKNLFILTLIFIIYSHNFFKCGKDFIIIDEIKITSKTKIAIIKNKKKELYIVQFIGKNYDVISMERKLEKESNYELDNMQRHGMITIIEVFLRQEGVNSSFGFLFSNDNNESFKYVDINDIDSTNSESIEKIKFDTLNNCIFLSLYSLVPKRHFVSCDWCNTWRYQNK